MYAVKLANAMLFLSTLSLRRATQKGGTRQNGRKFLSTLSLRRATSIERCSLKKFIFLSTLSLRRATTGVYFFWVGGRISIHALLAESDQVTQTCRAKIGISIHALLAESDSVFFIIFNASCSFLSTLSLRRATKSSCKGLFLFHISIHALLAESDSKSAQNSGALLRI